jgi:hypothetical protein
MVLGNLRPICYLCWKNISASFAGASVCGSDKEQMTMPGITITNVPATMLLN